MKRASESRHCCAGVCSSPVHCREIGRCFSASASRPVDPDRPAFYIEVIEGTHLGTSVARINWNCAGGFARPLVERLRLIGRYACHRVDLVGVTSALVEPAIDVPLHLAQRVEAGLREGLVSNETVREFSAIVAAAKNKVRHT